MQKPLAVYIHWPFCKAKCPYCDFNSHVRESVEFDRWRVAMLAELDHMASHVKNHKVTSIFFGGGTPSLMPPAIAEALIARVQEHWSVANDIEITLEANPTSVEASTFPGFKAAGVNRVSLGVQSFNDADLKFLGREHSSAEALKAIELARKNFERYSFDLIYARPQQTVQSWEKELAEALPLIEGHMSLYQLTIEENTAFAHAYKKGGFKLPDEETSEALYMLTGEMLSARGLEAYEVSNYAKAGEESRHNLSYWRGDDYVGIGAGAHGRITVDGNRIATATLKSPERWLENVEKNGHAIDLWEEVDKQAEIEERVMMGLRLKEGIDLAEFTAQTGYDLSQYINASKRTFFIEKDLLVNDPDKLQATLKGRLLLNQLTAELLA